MQENIFLDKVADSYLTATSPISKWNIDSYILIYKQYLHNAEGKGLELGCSSGYSTVCLSQLLYSLDVVDGSKRMLDNLSDSIKEIKNVNYIYSLFEELNFQENYDYIFCSYVLEHVQNPSEILDVCYRALKPGGKLFITVPNANALSRQMALEMGIIKDLYGLTENDLAHGHRRVYDLNILHELIEKTSFHLISSGGTFLKPFADFQLNQMIHQQIINETQLEGMQLLAKRYPEISGSIYAILEKV